MKLGFPNRESMWLGLFVADTTACMVEQNPVGCTSYFYIQIMGIYLQFQLLRENLPTDNSTPL